MFKCRSELLLGLETEDLGVATVWNSHSQNYKLKAKAQCAGWALLTGKPMSVSCFIRRFMIQASSCLLDVFMPLVNKWEIPLMGWFPHSLWWDVHKRNGKWFLLITHATERCISTLIQKVLKNPPSNATTILFPQKCKILSQLNRCSVYYLVFDLLATELKPPLNLRISF